MFRFLRFPNRFRKCSRLRERSAGFIELTLCRGIRGSTSKTENWLWLKAVALHGEIVFAGFHKGARPRFLAKPLEALCACESFTTMCYAFGVETAKRKRPTDRQNVPLRDTLPAREVFLLRA